MNKQQKIEASKAAGRFRYLIIDANDEEYCIAHTFKDADSDARKCKGEAWLAGRMVFSYR